MSYQGTEIQPTICLPASLSSARRLKHSIHTFEKSTKGTKRRSARLKARSEVQRFLADFRAWADELTCDDFSVLHNVARRSLPEDLTQELSPENCLLAFVLEVAGSDRPRLVPGSSIFDLSSYEYPQN